MLTAQKEADEMMAHVRHYLGSAEYHACPQCGERRRTQLHKVKKDGLEVTQCCRCGHEFCTLRQLGFVSE